MVVYNMRVIYLHLLLANLFLLSGCEEESEISKVETDYVWVDSELTPQSMTSPWVVNSDKDYLSENSISYSPTESITVVDAGVTNTEAFEKLSSNGHKTYAFDDISFEVIGLNEYFVVNNTPDRISTLLIRTTSFQQPVLLKMDSPLSPFSRTRVVFQQNISDISLVNTNNMFLPQITMTGNVSAQQGTQCTSVCYSEPDEQQTAVYQILSSNLHKSFNHKSFLPEMMRFYRDDWCADSSRNCSEDVAKINYMMMGAKGHKFSLKVLSGPYANEGVGGGSSPSLSDLKTGSSGWASVWADYITTGSAHARPYEGRTQKTIFHEGAHGHGFNHDSGMTYGMADYYGLEFLDKYFLAEDINGVSELKPSSIVPILVDAQNNYLKYKLVKLEEGDDITRVSSRVISGERISRRDRFTVEEGNLFYELELAQFPKQAVVIQFYDDATPRVSTTREIANFYHPEAITVSGSSLQFFEPPHITLDGPSYISVNAICRKYLPGSRGATKSEYQALWSASDFSPSKLEGTFFISSNMSQANHRWRINMKNTDSFSKTSEGRYTKFSEEDSLLCVS